LGVRQQVREIHIGCAKVLKKETQSSSLCWSFWSDLQKLDDAKPLPLHNETG